MPGELRAHLDHRCSLLRVIRYRTVQDTLPRSDHTRKETDDTVRAHDLVVQATASGMGLQPCLDVYILVRTATAETGKRYESLEAEC